MTEKSKTKVITGKCRASYANVFVPTSIEENQEKKYNISLLIPKEDTKTVEAVKAAVKAAFDEGRAAFGGEYPKGTNWHNPLRDGDEEKPDDENYTGMYFLNAKSKSKPEIITDKGRQITDAEDFYSGCYCRASLNFYAFGKGLPKKGIGVGLNSLMKVDDGERLGGGAAPAATDFGIERDDLM